MQNRDCQPFTEYLRALIDANINGDHDAREQALSDLDYIAAIIARRIQEKERANRA